MKKIFIAFLAMILSLSITATSSYARNLKKHQPAKRSKAPALAGVDNAGPKNLRHRFSHPDPSRKAYGQHNTNKYLSAPPKAWSPQKHRPAKPPLKFFANNGNHTGHYKYRYRFRHHGSSSWVNRPYYTNQYPINHWRVKKTWVPPKTNRVWKAGYRNSLGRWVPGRWVTINARPAFPAQNWAWIFPR